MDDYASNSVNNDKDWSEFVTNNSKETSDNPTHNLNTQSKETIETQASHNSVENRWSIRT